MRKVIIPVSAFLITALLSYSPNMELISNSSTNALPSHRISFKIPDDDGEVYNRFFHDVKALKLVVIDAGHGGYDPGANVGTLLEKDISLDIALRVDTILRKSGISTYMIRSTDDSVNHIDRITTANGKKAVLFLSIHCDWYKNSLYNGTSTLYYPSKSLRSGNLTEIEYAKIIQGELMKVLETKDRGIIDRTDLSVLKRAKMPSVIVELGFLSNERDARLLSSEDFRQRAAQGLASGIQKSLDQIE